MRVKVVASTHIKEECLEEYLPLMKEIVEKTNALDKGCIRYELCRDTQNPLRFTMIEEWESQADLDAHMESAHFKEIIPKTGPFAAAPPDIAIYEKVF